MNSRNDLLKNAGIALSVLALIMSLVFVAEVGLSETGKIMTGSDDVSAATNATMGGSVDFLEQAVVIGMGVGLIGPAGLGLYATSRSDPEALRFIEKNHGWFVAAVGIIGFWSVVNNVLTGDYDWNANTNAINAFNGYVAAATAVGILQFLGLKK